MHRGNIENEGTAVARLFWFLLDAMETDLAARIYPEECGWRSTLQIAQGTNSVCAGTRISELRQTLQIKSFDERIEHRVRAHPIEKGIRIHDYRMTHCVPHTRKEGSS